jgi:uncharacterized protein (DUF2141 family)
MAADTKNGNLIINLSHLRNNKGVVRISLFNNKEGFPNQYEKAIKFESIPSESPQMQIILVDIPYGEYALAILHDENNNKKMDFNFLRIPKEGYAVSNNAKGTFGPPKYKDAKFNVNQDSVFFDLKMNY